MGINKVVVVVVVVETASILSQQQLQRQRRKRKRMFCQTFKNQEKQFSTFIFDSACVNE